MAPINNQLQTRTISNYLNNFHLFPSFFKSKSLGKFTYFRFRRKTTYVRLNYNKWLKHLYEWTLNCWKWVDFERFILSLNDVQRFVFNSAIFQCSMRCRICNLGAPCKLTIFPSVQTHKFCHLVQTYNFATLKVERF